MARDCASRFPVREAAPSFDSLRGRMIAPESVLFITARNSWCRVSFAPFNERRYRSALSAENLFLRKQLTLFHECWKTTGRVPVLSLLWAHRAPPWITS